MSDFASLVDLENRTVHPRVFVDPEIYKAEQEKLFGRCWFFIGHESQVPNQGDYVTTYMGEEPVIFVKDRSDRLRVFLNSCRHRGVKVCRKDHGNTKIFTCPYHGWSYNTEGGLQGVPQIREAYHNEIDKDQIEDSDHESIESVPFISEPVKKKLLGSKKKHCVFKKHWKKTN